MTWELWKSKLIWRQKKREFIWILHCIHVLKLANFSHFQWKVMKPFLAWAFFFSPQCVGKRVSNTPLLLPKQAASLGLWKPNFVFRKENEPEYQWTGAAFRSVLRITVRWRSSHTFIQAHSPLTLASHYGNFSKQFIVLCYICWLCSVLQPFFFPASIQKLSAEGGLRNVELDVNQ